MKYGMRTFGFVLFFFVCLTSLFLPGMVLAQCGSAEECQQQIDDLNSKISAVQQQSKTLSSAISYLNLKQSLTQRQIDATAFQIQLLERDIQSLTGKISVLQGSLNTLTASLLKNIVASYKQRTDGGVDVLLTSKNFAEALTSYRYLNIARQYRQDLLFKTTQTKVEYDAEKTTKEKKQLEITRLNKQYESQKQDLISQQVAKQQLLDQTKNSEVTYQKLLADALSQLSSFKAFSTSKGLGLLSPQTSPDGWFFSQRDQRWGGMKIGSSTDTIMEVGCLLSDIAMIKKKYGENVTPISIAANTSYFFSTTAYMLLPWPSPAGYHFSRSGYSQGSIDAALADGRPVVAHLRINTGDGHFVVLKSGSGGNYVMHDPWEGYDKNFKDFYSLGQISDINILVKN